MLTVNLPSETVIYLDYTTCIICPECISVDRESHEIEFNLDDEWDVYAHVLMMSIGDCR